MSVANTGADTTQAGGGTQGAEQSANGQPAQGQTQQTQQTPEGQQAQGQEQQQPGAKTETTAEVVYDFKAPEGMELDGKAVEQFKPLAKELGLKADGAQKLVDFYGNQLKAQAQAHAEMQQAWVSEVTSDPEYGGAKLEESKALAKAAMDHIGDPKLKEFLDTSGLGNHPAVIAWAAEIGKRLSPDTFENGTRTVAADKPLANRLFPNLP